MNDFCAFLAFLLFTFLMITIGVLLGIKFFQSEIIEFVCENTYNKNYEVLYCKHIYTETTSTITDNIILKESIIK